MKQDRWNLQQGFQGSKVPNPKYFILQPVTILKPVLALATLLQGALTISGQDECGECSISIRLVVAGEDSAATWNCYHKLSTVTTKAEYSYHQGWVIRRRRIIRRTVFITYISVFFELLRIIRFWALNEFAATSPQSTPEALPGPQEPHRGTSKPSRAPRGTPSPSERSMITCLLLPQPRRWCL